MKHKLSAYLSGCRIKVYHIVGNVIQHRRLKSQLLFLHALILLINTFVIGIAADKLNGFRPVKYRHGFFGVFT